MKTWIRHPKDKINTTITYRKKRKVTMISCSRHNKSGELQGYLIKIIDDKQMMMTEKISEAFGNGLDTNLLAAVQTELNIKTVSAFPLKGKKKDLGVLMFGVSKRPQDIPAHEIKTMHGFVNAVDIALENSSLYTEVKKTTEKLQVANERLKELDKLKDEFVSLASHELRTPMTAIRGSLSTILDGFIGEINSQVREFLTAAYNENDRLIRLVNNLLNISRIEAGRLVFDIKQIDINKIITEVVNNFQSAAKEKNLQVVYQKNEQLPLVYTDGDKIKEVIINFIGNALKFTQKGGIAISAKRQDSIVVISVADTGPGIAEKDQALLFKKFSQVEGYSSKTGGTGLGLYISKKIIESLGGKVWIESEVGKGSTFFFSLPVKLTTRTAESLSKTKSENS